MAAIAATIIVKNTKSERNDMILYLAIVVLDY